MPEYSVMINQGAMDRAEAEQKMAEKIDEAKAKSELKDFCRYAGLSYGKIMLKAKIYSKRWW